MSLAEGISTEQAQQDDDPKGAASQIEQPSHYKIDGKEISIEQIKAGLDAESNRQKWQRTQTQRDQRISAAEKRLNAELERMGQIADRLDAHKGSQAEAEDELPDADKKFLTRIEKRMESMLEKKIAPITSHLSEVKRYSEKQQREADNKALDDYIGEMAKDHGIDKNELGYMALRDNRPLEDIAEELAAGKTKRAHKEPKTPPNPPPAAGGLGKGAPGAVSGDKVKMKDFEREGTRIAGAQAFLERFKKMAGGG